MLPTHYEHISLLSLLERLLRFLFPSTAFSISRSSPRFIPAVPYCESDNPVPPRSCPLRVDFDPLSLARPGAMLRSCGPFPPCCSIRDHPFPVRSLYRNRGRMTARFFARYPPLFLFFLTYSERGDDLHAWDPPSCPLVIQASRFAHSVLPAHAQVRWPAGSAIWSRRSLLGPFGRPRLFCFE